MVSFLLECREKKKESILDYRQMNTETLVHLFHLVIVGGLFLYVGIMRDKVPSILLRGLFWVGILILLYHTYKAYTYLRLGKSIWVNLIHIVLVGPLLIYIGYYGDKTPRLYFELLLMLGFASIGYHGYYLLKSLQT
jgi:hypothetical protein